jgi:DNA-binding transcriptional regulator YdaS (Cro superfamily)
LAQHFGLTQSAVSQWRTNGVPPHRMKAVRDYTGGAVTLDEMLPDQPATVPAEKQEVRDAA